MFADTDPGKITLYAFSIIIPFLIMLLSDVVNYSFELNSGIFFGFSIIASIMAGLLPLWNVIKHYRQVVITAAIAVYVVIGTVFTFSFHMFLGCYFFGDCI